MTGRTDPPVTLDQIDRMIAEGQWPLAAEGLEQLWATRPTLAHAQGILDRLPQGWSRAGLRLAILRSFTVEPLIPLVKAGAGLRGLSLDVYVGGFNAVATELLDPTSGLYAFAPDVVLLARQARDVSPLFWSRFPDASSDDVANERTRLLAELASWITALRRHSQAPLIVPTLEAPPWVQAGVLDAQHAGSQAEAIALVNQGIGEVARQHAGVYVLDYDALVARHGRHRWYDERKWLAMRMPLAADALNALADAYVRYLIPLAGLGAKVVVVDLDNTLWGGILGEEGAASLQLGPEYPGAAYLALQQALLDLQRRGLLLAIASKNDEADALDVLATHPAMRLRPEHFSAWRINWNDKAQSLREIAAELNVGLDALAFLDDNPAERALVRRALPDVRVIDLPDEPLAYAQAVRREPAFERLTLSAEDRERTRYYREARERQVLATHSDSLEDYLQSLGMAARIERATPATQARVAQLTQKTNQFNLTTQRYSEPEIVTRQADPAWRIYTLQLADRFGDHGLVGVAMVRRDADTWEIEAFLLSCRVIGRTAETALLAHLAAEARLAGAARLQGWFRPTAKNAPASGFYRDHGFHVVTEAGGASLWGYDLHGDPLPSSPWIAIDVAGARG